MEWIVVPSESERPISRGRPVQRPLVGRHQKLRPAETPLVEFVYRVLIDLCQRWGGRTGELGDFAAADLKGLLGEHLIEGAEMDLTLANGNRCHLVPDVNALEAGLSDEERSVWSDDFDRRLLIDLADLDHR